MFRLLAVFILAAGFLAPAAQAAPPELRAFQPDYALEVLPEAASQALGSVQTVIVRVASLGRVQGTSDLGIRFFLTGDPSAPGSATDAKQIPAPEAGEDAFVGFTPTASADLAPGRYYFCAEATVPGDTHPTSDLRCAEVSFTSPAATALARTRAPRRMMRWVR